MIRYRKSTAHRAEKRLDNSSKRCMMCLTSDATCFASRSVADKRTTRTTCSQLPGPSDSLTSGTTFEATLFPVLASLFFAPIDRIFANRRALRSTA